MTTLLSNSTLVIFENKTNETAWVQFLNGAFGPNQTGANGAVALSGDTAYSFSDLTSTVPGFSALGSVPNVLLNDFTNGRIYFNFGSAGLQGLGNGYQPSPSSSLDANYNTVFAYVEPNFFGTASNNLDMTNIDFVSMAIELSTWKDGQQVGAMVLKNNDPAFIGGQFEKLGTLSGGQAVVGKNMIRVLGPWLSPGYHDWSAYFTYLTTQTPATIGGNYGGGPDAAQAYTLTATFDDTTQQVTLSGTLSLSGATTIVFDYADLNAPTGVYGANAGYSVNGGAKTPGILNDVYGWIAGDLFAGLNLGFLGSQTQYNGQTIGSYQSQDWFTIAQAAPNLQFGGAQSNPQYYNEYAAQMMELTVDAYSFAFSDRIEQLLLYFPPAGQPGAVDYLKITLLPVAFPA